MTFQALARTLSLGYSPCPNDTFIFYALVHGRIDTAGLGFKETLLDVETLNRKAVNSELDITKVSFHAFGFLRGSYQLLRSGGALGRGCGPLVVAKRETSMEDLRGKKIAIPGRLTTAYLLLQLYDPMLGTNVVVMPFDRIMDAVKRGTVDAGLIIHESRFTYPDYGLLEVMDLGRWWEGDTGLPLPLGCIVAKKSLGTEVIHTIDMLVRKSVEYAFAHRERTREYIKAHSQELEDAVIEQHINLYVNDYSLDLGSEGMAAIEELLRRAGARGIVPGGINAAVR
ncbi:MAG: 1,4-dihydroxy-6-naphthoate synthase [Nitrospirae bacterium]|nr:1,4-dihydroxy-6-naphthoate synthase [Nitrospirota bacterium]MCL5420872.1 1,4-dihydroxy-6-naphthoate synthase [Nitrospirota bacterium]